MISLTLFSFCGPKLKEIPGLVRPGDLDQYHVSRTSVMAEYLEKYDREATETEKKEQKTDRRAEEDKNSGVRVIILCEFVIADVCACARVCVCASRCVCMCACSSTCGVYY